MTRIETEMQKLTTAERIAIVKKMFCPRFTMSSKKVRKGK